MKSSLLFLTFLCLVIFADISCDEIPTCSQRDYTYTNYDENTCFNLEITNEGDSHCCYWENTDSDGTDRCSSISHEQYLDLNNYISRKKKDYEAPNLNIKCKLPTCSQRDFKYNSFDESSCANLKIIDEGDTHCCYWENVDSSGTDRCSSLSSEQYADLTSYISSKKEDYGVPTFNIKCAAKEQSSSRYTNVKLALYFVLSILLL